MKTTRKNKCTDISALPPPVTGWIKLDMGIENWRKNLSRYRRKVHAAKAFIFNPENQALAKLCTKYVPAYTSFAVVGAHASILLLEGDDVWREYFMLATLSPIAVSLPIALHGASIHLRSLKSSVQFKRLLDHDDLTGLKSRRYVLEQLNQRPRPFNYVVMIDMDRLKHINDQLGHLEGDAALNRLARVLETSAEDGDVVGRLSGDEFVILSTANNVKKRQLNGTKHIESARCHKQERRSRTGVYDKRRDRKAVGWSNHIRGHSQCRPRALQSQENGRQLHSDRGLSTGM